MKKEAIGLVVFGGLAACSSGTSDNPTTTDMDASANTAQVTGTLTYRERIALPPGAVAEVWLLDTSLADAPSVEIAHQRIDDPGNPPIPFVLEYDTSKIQEGMQYSVRATIKQANKLLFTSDTHYPVLTRGADDTADVLLIMVDRNR